MSAGNRNRKRRAGRSCVGCGKELNRQTKGERCVTCFGAARKLPRGSCSSCGKGLSLQNSTGLCVGCCAIRNGRAARADPATLARIRAAARRMVPLMFTPEARAKWRAGREDVGRRRTERALGWCPPEYRDLYREMLIRKGIEKTEARRMVLEQVAADEAKLSPLARQIRALKNGGTLTEKFVPVRRDYEFTLGGVSGL